MSKNNYWVSPRDLGWSAKREGATRASGVFDTQEDAVNFAHQIMTNNQGGELITQGKHGQIVSKDTINWPDYNPPKDREH